MAEKSPLDDQSLEDVTGGSALFSGASRFGLDGVADDVLMQASQLLSGQPPASGGTSTPIDALHQTSQQGQDMTQQMLDVIGDVRSKLESIQPSGSEAGNRSARNI